MWVAIGLALSIAGYAAYRYVRYQRDRTDYVTPQWLDEQAAGEGRSGWDGPRWRLKTEREAEERREQFRRISAIRRQQKRRTA